MSRRAIIRFLSVLICVLLAGGVGVGYAAYQRVKSISPTDLINQKADEVETLSPEEAAELETAEVEPPKVNDKDFVMYKGEKYSYNENIITLLLIGIDIEPGRSSARSDVMVVFAMDYETKQPTLIVCPRDTYTKVRHTDDEGNEKKVEDDKLNHSFPYGGGGKDRNMGASNVAYNLRNLLTCGGKYDDIQLDRWGGLDMQGIGPLTDAVGGVTLVMPATMSGVGKQGETVKLNGEKAKTYVTTRKGVQGGSDTMRGQRQMKYLFALLESITEIDPLQIPGVYNQIQKNTFTNLTTEEMVGYAKLLAEADLGNIFQTQLEGTPKTMNKISYYVLDEDKLEELVISVFYTKLEDDDSKDDPSASPSDDAEETNDAGSTAKPKKSASPSPSGDDN